MKNKLTSTYTICFGAMLSCLLWGSAAPCIKIGYSLFEISGTASQLLFAGIRFIIAGILTILFGSILSRKILIPQKSSIPDVFKLAMVQTVLQYIFYYIGLANTSGVNASIINASNVFVSLLFSCLLFKFEKLTTRKIFGSVIGFLGVILINISGAAINGNFSFAGEGAIFMSCLSYGLSSCLIKRYSQRENPVTLSGYQFFTGGIVLTIIGFLCGGRIYSCFNPSCYAFDLFGSCFLDSIHFVGNTAEIQSCRKSGGFWFHEPNFRRYTLSMAFGRTKSSIQHNRSCFASADLYRNLYC